jgi:hypothetical protein
MISTSGVKELPLSNIVNLNVKLDLKYWLPFDKMVDSHGKILHLS